MGPPQVLDNQRHARLHRLIDSGANEFSSYIESDIRARIPALQRIAGRWEAQGGTPKEEFVLDSAAYVEDMPGFQALGWVDESFHVRWIIPLEGNEPARDFDLSVEEKRRIALETARDSDVPTMTGLVDLVQGGKGLLIYFPIMVEDEFSGFVSAVFRVSEWLDYVFSLGDTSRDDPAFLAAVEIEGQQAYAQPGWYPDYQQGWQATSHFELMGQPMSVTVQPTAEFFRRNASAVPEIVGASGILLSVLVAILVYLYQRAGLAARSAMVLSGSLQTEVGERKRAQEKLQRAQEKLEERVAERTAELHQANEDLRVEIEERQRAKKGEEALRKQLTHASRLGAIGDMATGLAHEINQPLTAIANYSAVCIRFLRNGTGDPEDVIEDLEKIKVQVERAGDIIKWLRNAVRQEDRGRTSLNINACITEVGDLMGADFGKYGASLIYDLSDDLPEFSGNKVQIQQVFVNLLQNSMKAFGDDAEKHQITIRSSLGSDGKICIRVEDNGPGVPVEMQNEIFKPFVSTRREGLGFGLSISRTIIEAHGGLIWHDATIEDGAVFRIELPADRRAH